MLALKLLLVPGFLGLVSLVGRRWGPRAAGWMAGLPIVAGPILYFLALERGPDFGAQAASAALSAVLASVSFSVVYCWVCIRHGWVASLFAGLCAWFAAALLLAQIPALPWVSLAVAVATLLLAPKVFPKPRTQISGNALPKAELLYRMVAGAVLTLLVTAIAATIGSAWSGLSTVFPLLGTVLAVFSQRTNGASFVIVMLRAMATGLYSFGAFSFALALLLPVASVNLAFVASAVISLLVQGIAILGPGWVRRREAGLRRW